MNIPESPVSSSVVLANLNVVLSAFVESNPNGICIGDAKLYLNDVPLSVTDGISIGTTFLNLIIHKLYPLVKYRFNYS